MTDITSFGNKLSYLVEQEGGVVCGVLFNVFQMSISIHVYGREFFNDKVVQERSVNIRVPIWSVGRMLYSLGVCHSQYLDDTKAFFCQTFTILVLTCTFLF
jgi:hypothetical protein